MKRIQNRLYHPLFVVPSSVFLSLTAYIIAHYIIHWEHFWVGFFLSVLIPLMVSLPIALLMDGYFKKINKQKIELERLDSANKKLFALISHDVRAPLDSLKGMIELVVNETIDLEESKLYFDKLSNKLEHFSFLL